MSLQFSATDSLVRWLSGGAARAAGSGPAREVFLNGLIARDVARTKKRRTRSAALKG
jgi:hypothetical protein